MKTLEERKQELQRIIDNANEELFVLNLKTDKRVLLSIIKNELGLDIRKKTRKGEYVLGRQIYSTIRYKEKVSFQKIGVELGGQDHATVMHACQKLETRMFREKKVKELYEKIYKLYTEI